MGMHLSELHELVMGRDIYICVCICTYIHTHTHTHTKLCYEAFQEFHDSLWIFTLVERRART